HEYGARERIREQELAAHAREAVDATPEVRRLDCHEQSHLGGDLDHRARRQNVSTSATTSTAAAPNSTSIRSPSRATKRTTVFGDKPSRLASSSTKRLASAATAVPSFFIHASSRHRSSRSARAVTSAPSM